MKVAVVGATGLVGRNMIKVLEERRFPVTELIPVASEKSVGKKIKFNGKEWSVVSPATAVAMKPAVAIFSAGADVSKEWAPKFAAVKCYVVDNSSYWRMDKTKRLVIPEINADVIKKSDYIIANPNCSTIQMLVAIADLHKKFKIKRIVVSTYQCITGTGKKAVDELDAERSDQTGTSCYYSPRGTKGRKTTTAYPYQIDLNLLPHIDKFLPTGYTKEEMKMVDETHKIMRDDKIKVSPTTVRVPVIGGHGESVNLEFAKPATLKNVYAVLKKTKGVIVQDNTLPNGCSAKDPYGKQNKLIGAELPAYFDTSSKTAAGKKYLERLAYPMPVYSQNRDEVFVGRVRMDPTLKSGINLWCVADNLRKGAATNAVQIAEVLLKKNFIR
ncbi:MAG: aspartate-semialdehyde dehydrogenase [Bacteroidales bacterium]|jgi:aspartate-semialdehyde dehydrogenase|nr:aspartate-semialdehyde dehydrogenase [Bacteroidales bacterium]